MFTDMVGYSALTQRDEALALELLVEHHKLLRPILPRYGGREIKTIGDAILVEFASALEAVGCAISMQRVLATYNATATPARRTWIRIGIHVGDVEHRNGDVFGDAVNIASRIEPQARPGGICVSEDVARQVQNKLDVSLLKIGKSDLKNIRLPVEIYEVALPWLTLNSTAEVSADGRNRQGKQSATGLSRPVWHFVMALAVIAAVLIAIIAVRRTSPPSPKAVARFVIPLTEEERPSQGSEVAISPDGTYIALLAVQDGVSRIYIRQVSEATTKVLSGTEGASHPFFSPDGRWIGFFSQGKLNKIPLSGGAAIPICDAPSGRGAFWADDGTIVLSPEARNSGVFQVSENGGEARPITHLNIAAGETSHRMPILLPGNQVVLYTTYGSTYQDVKIVAQRLGSKEQKILVEGGSQPWYSSTGHLLYVQPKVPGSLIAVPFDIDRVELRGAPVPVAENIFTMREDSARWSVSRNGMLIYAPGGLQQPNLELVWVDRKGNMQSLPFPARRYQFPNLSPDGKKVVVAFADVQLSIWVLSLADFTMNRLTFEGNSFWPIWTPDGERIIYGSNRNEPYTPYWKAADGSGKEERVLPRGIGGVPYSWSPDGKYLLLTRGGSLTTGSDIYLATMGSPPKLETFLATRGQDFDAQISPDGRWAAFSTDESGQFEVYVVSFPGASERRQISTGGGREPRWARNGRELFFRKGAQMMSVEITTQPTFSAATPTELFVRTLNLPDTGSPDYDVSPDGQRFLMLREAPHDLPPLQLNVVLNWFEELKERVPLQ
jgi:eukaryotic-like serine/threonine-protein kinase